MLLDDRPCTLNRLAVGSRQLLPTARDVQVRRGLSPVRSALTWGDPLRLHMIRVTYTVQGQGQGQARFFVSWPGPHRVRAKPSDLARPWPDLALECGGSQMCHTTHNNCHGVNNFKLNDDTNAAMRLIFFLLSKFFCVSFMFFFSTN